MVKTGSANLASVLAALARAGAEAELSQDAGAVAAAARLVLPGVGAFGAAVERLRTAGLYEVLARRIREGRPTLAICLGLQLLAEESEESPGTKGLGVIPGKVRRFPANVRVPQLGWNRVQPDGSCHLVSTGYAYYANSYRLETPPPNWSTALSLHGGPFVAALEKGAVLACQFHPELSGAWGASLLSRWLEATC